MSNKWNEETAKQNQSNDSFSVKKKTFFSRVKKNVDEGEGGDDSSGGGFGKRHSGDYKKEKLLGLIGQGKFKAGQFQRFLIKEGVDVEKDLHTSDVVQDVEENIEDADSKEKQQEKKAKAELLARETESADKRGRRRERTDEVFLTERYRAKVASAPNNPRSETARKYGNTLRSNNASFMRQRDAVLSSKQASEMTQRTAIERGEKKAAPTKLFGLAEKNTNKTANVTSEHRSKAAETVTVEATIKAGMGKR